MSVMVSIVSIIKSVFFSPVVSSQSDAPVDDA